MEETMLAYIFWHVPFAGISPGEYEAASLGFQRDLAAAPPPGFASCATYQISEVPWLDGRRGYEDWYFIESSAALDALNEAAVAPRRRDVHAAIASKMDFGHGGLYRHVFGEAQTVGARVVWLARPRGIDYEPVLRKIADGSSGFLSCWRRQMVLGPADEFAVIGTSSPNIAVPPGWRGRAVERTIVGPASVSV
jgi:hypothetical protein